MTKLKKANLLLSLYLAQGLPFGFFTQALPVLLRKSNVSLSVIGLAHLLSLPWAIKFVWAPAVDRWQWPSLGLRRSWLIPLQAASVLIYVGLASITLEGNLALVLAAFLISNFLAAAQDVATDGLAIDILETDDRGWANGIQVAGYRLGMLIGGGALLVIFDQLKWVGLMSSMALITLLCTIPVWRFQEISSRITLPHTRGLSEVMREIFHFFTLTGAPLWTLVLLLYKTGHASATAMLRPWLVDRGYSLTEIAALIGSAGFLPGFLGAIAGGALLSFASRFNTETGTSWRPRLLVLLGFLQCLAVCSYLWPLFTPLAGYKIIIATAFDHFTSGMATAALFTLMMDASSEARAASHYTTQACLVVISQGVGPILAGFFAEYFGYGVQFALSSGLAVSAVLVTWLCLRTGSVRKLLSSSQAGR